MILTLQSIKPKHKLQGKMQGWNRFMVGQATVRKHTNIREKQQNKNINNHSNRKTKAKGNITSITDHSTKNECMGDTNPKSVKPGSK